MTTLEHNLSCLPADVAQRIRDAEPADIEWSWSEDGGPTAKYQGQLLASRVHAIGEASALAIKAPIGDSPCICVLGFGLGYHAAMVGLMQGRNGVLIVYEPDLSLLRTVFSKIDHGWMRTTSFLLLTDPDDTTAISGPLTGTEGIVTLGVHFLDHPPSRHRLAPTVDRFCASLTEVMRAARTTVVTTLMHIQLTVQNYLDNILHYTMGPGIADLEGAAAGRPCVVVSAGPSLRRNVHLLQNPEHRARVVVVAVQTVLKPLLALGIRPDYVCALDYHEVSARFYEGLTASDVEGVTLIAEPKANGAILNAFPGVVRCPCEPVLDQLLGPLARDMGAMRSGSTVAHLAYYIGRYLGCDPVILIGQDLGFTDGQYYAAGATIHNVWGPEFGPFCTPEMMEHERIFRHRHMLIRATDIHDRPIYTDEQMHTYQLQFEREWRADKGRGMTTVDATEGGTAKDGVEVMTFADALAKYAVGDPIVLPAPPELPDPEGRREALMARIKEVRGDCAEVSGLCNETEDILSQMKDTDDEATMNGLLKQAYKIRDRIEELDPAYHLAHHLNQVGTLNRVKADRAIALAQ